MTKTNNKGYFEGILQIRNPKKEIIEFALTEIDNKDNVHISKMAYVKNGLDIYLTSQKFLRSLGNKLRNNFGGQLIVSKKLHTQNRITSRNVYRVNVLFRMPHFKKSDIIEYKGSKIKIIAAHKKVLAKDVKTGKKLNLRFKDLIK